MASIRDVFLGATGRRYAKTQFVVNGKVYKTGLRSLTEGERTDFEMVRAVAQNETDAKSAEASYRRRLLVMTVMQLHDNPTCDPQCKGCQKCVTDTPEFQYDDIIAMEAVDCGVTCPIYNDALRHVYVTEADIEELAKNSVATAGGSSPEKSA